MGSHPLGDATARDGATQEEAERAEAGRHREPRRAGGGEADQDHVAGHVGDEHVPEAQEADGIEKSTDDGEGRQRDHQGLWRTIGLHHGSLHLPRDPVAVPASVNVTEAVHPLADRSLVMRERMPRVPPTR